MHTALLVALPSPFHSMLHRHTADPSPFIDFSWCELFYDLIYVCAASSVTEIVEEHPDGTHLAYFFLAALTFASTWYVFS
jgi:low temperature requirement protein LtrA